MEDTKGAIKVSNRKDFHSPFLKIVVKYIQHKIYHLNHFLVYSSVVLHIFTLLCNQQPEHFWFAKLKLYTH